MDPQHTTELSVFTPHVCDAPALTETNEPMGARGDVRSAVLWVGVGVELTPPLASVSSRSRTSLIAMAIPIPSTGLPSSDSKSLDVLTPTTRPFRSKSGPPLFPGLSAASVWSSLTPDSEILFADTMPLVIVGEPSRMSTSPKGYPMAMTSSPTATTSDSPRVTGSKSSEPRSSRRAMSTTSSKPKTSLWYICPLGSLTSTVSNPWTTWALVTTSPSSSMMNPEPVPEGVIICTTPPETSLTIDESVGVLVGAGVGVDVGIGECVGVGVDVGVAVGVCVCVG